MLLTRVITAVVLLAICLAAVSLGPQTLGAMLAVALALVLAEWLRMVPGSRAWAWPAAAVAGAVGVAMSFAGVVPSGPLFMGLELAACAVWMGLLGVVFVARDRGFAVSQTASITLSALIVSATFLSMLWMIEHGGWQLLLSVFMIVWLADVCAYFSGRAFGRHKMAVAISPKKTWEGAAGAFVSVAVCALLAWWQLPHHWVFSSIVFEHAGFVAGMLVVLLLVAISIAGDLFESALKRQAGIKDSGRLLPGHGGFYDRLDAAVAVFPCATAALLVI